MFVTFEHILFYCKKSDNIFKTNWGCRTETESLSCDNFRSAEKVDCFGYTCIFHCVYISFCLCIYVYIHHSSKVSRYPKFAWNELHRRVKKRIKKELLESSKKRMNSIIKLILWEPFATNTKHLRCNNGEYFIESKI